LAERPLQGSPASIKEFFSQPVRTTSIDMTT
jgi:hypothetical protein